MPKLSIHGMLVNLSKEDTSMRARQIGAGLIDENGGGPGVRLRNGPRGLIDADLGGGVIKQRLAREGQGKSGGFRSIVLFRRSEKAFFVYGFAKSDKDNIRRDELKAFRKLAGEMLSLDDKALAAAMRNGTITEIKCHG
jgi:hypothetical protein